MRMGAILSAVAQAGSAGGFNWATVVASLGGSTIVALVALAGVILTQKNERARAHEDRIWHQKAEAYLAVFRWADGWWNIYSGQLLERDFQPSHLVSSSEYWTLEMYGSRRVVELFEVACEVRKRDAEKSIETIVEEHRSEPNPHSRIVMMELMDEIQKETRGNFT